MVVQYTDVACCYLVCMDGFQRFVEPCHELRCIVDKRECNQHGAGASNKEATVCVPSLEH